MDKEIVRYVSKELKLQQTVIKAGQDAQKKVIAFQKVLAKKEAKHIEEKKEEIVSHIEEMKKENEQQMMQAKQLADEQKARILAVNTLALAEKLLTKL